MDDHQILIQQLLPRPDIEVSQFLLAISQKAHDIETLSNKRRCAVVTSHRRYYDVVLRLRACWFDMFDTAIRQLESVLDKSRVT